MNRKYGEAIYSTYPFNDLDGGSAGLELRKVIEVSEVNLARVVFWDALGQFFFEAREIDIPLVILEEFIAEAKEVVNVK